MLDNSIAVLFVTETWLTEANNNITAAIKSSGFRIVHRIRASPDKTRGGGVGVIHSAELNLTQVFISHGNTFESVCVKFKDSDGVNICCACVYRPGVLSDTFFAEFDDFIGDIFVKFTRMMICGDLNIHLDNCRSQYAKKFSELISSYGLAQLVTVPTHRLGHLLDVVLCSHKVIDTHSVVVNRPDVSIFPSCDHFPITFQFGGRCGGFSDKKKTIVFRNIKKICMEDFRSDLESELITTNSADFENVIALYDSKCIEVLDKHAPVLTKEIRDRKSAPWFDGEYKCLRSLRRKAEKKRKQTNSSKDITSFVEIREKCKKLAEVKKQAFFREQFIRHSHSPKSLFSFVDSFMDKDQSLKLPPSDSLKETVDKFNDFFQQKVELIRGKFDVERNRLFTESNQASYTGPELSTFDPTTIDEISEILKDTGFKSSSIDPLPSSLLKENADLFLPILCDIVNASLASGSIDGAKLANITPLIKGQGLDNSQFKNYRPISNLSFVGKLIERVVHRRLNDHLSSHNLNMPYQSGYKKNFSTETLLVRIVNDLLVASDQNTATIVMMLDLSAAFDTVDHQKLLSILKSEIGITGSALKWFNSFLVGRCQRVKVGDEESYEIIIKFGVPQGSVLGPVLFNIYIRSLYATVKKLKFSIQGYADDHQIYKSFKCLDEYSVMTLDVPACFKEISEWMSYHYLQLNPGKTELIVFGSPAVLSKLSLNGVFLDSDVCVRLSPVVKNLGFRLDGCLTFNQQVMKVKSNCYNKLRQIGKMKPFLTSKQITTLVQAIVVSLLDYCNALYFGCSKSVISQLQSIQNRACRVIFGLKKRDSVDDKLQSLHWLKIQERIEFKVLLLVYKSLNGVAPCYLNEVLRYNNTSGRRASMLHIPLSTKSSSSRAFQTAGPKLWHKLPCDIRSSENIVIFKNRLKTHLFKRCYNI